ncbi:MAG: helix-turn-helix domain-containing protein [Candidatus Obscuribacterales bacterium]|nr:helix-turn-helix domain-containing protein [Candidatus Obscuribacterales bacterium]
MHLPESFAATCCQVLRERRLKLGLSQEEIARRSGLARSYICDVERGARHPSLRNVSTLARALEIPTSELINLVEVNLASQVDLDALRTNREQNGLHSEIIRYFNERVSDGIIIADQNGFIFFNQAAEKLTGLGRRNVEIDDWSDEYGCFKSDKTTKFPSRELPLVRAIAGESLDNVQVFVKNDGAPEGRSLLVTARPVKVNGGAPVAGVVIFREENGV